MAWGGTYTDADDLVHAAPGRLDDALDVLDALARALGDGALDHLARGVGVDLAGDPDLSGGFDGLAVRRGGWGLERLAEGVLLALCVWARGC